MISFGGRVLQICVVKKKMIQILTVSETQLTVMTEIALAETPLEIVYSEPFVCFASSSEYHVLNVKENKHQVHHLFPHPDHPVIASLTDSDVSRCISSFVLAICCLAETRADGFIQCR